ncbi:mitochondrial fission regulator domain-containing protein [Ditylenchus destructor]|uniref:Mitochondrial fission regulator domain-containing protein n=1 Tax=Ditylenchus destructor TaxID=166010 RepID=A0AAD4R713_9BILA|nr:mitochondrial fission regulator domain-containing protein [Ditylenchus destructor]
MESDEEALVNFCQGVTPRQNAEEPPLSQLLLDIIGQEDFILRLRSIAKLMGTLFGITKTKTARMISRLNFEVHLKRAYELASIPILSAVSMLNTQISHRSIDAYYYESTGVSYMPIRTEPVSNRPSLINLHELHGDPTENAIYRQWQFAPLEFRRRKFNSSKSKFYSVQPRVKSRMQVYSSCSSARLSPIDMNDEDDLDECDRFSLGSSTAGASTVNPEDKNRINHLEAQLAQLQSQMNQLLKARGAECAVKQSLPDQLPSLLPSVHHSPTAEPPKKCAPPPPAPPPPPADFLRSKPTAKIENRTGASNSAKENDGTLHPKLPEAKPRMVDVLKGLENIKLRKVDRSPNGTPMRGNIHSWPKSRGINKHISNVGSENKIPFTNEISEVNDNSLLDDGPMNIATILRKKFRNVRPSDSSFNESDNDEDDAIWDEDLSDLGCTQA